MEEEQKLPEDQKPVKNSGYRFHHDKKKSVFAVRNEWPLLTALCRFQSRTLFDFESGGALRSAQCEHYPSNNVCDLWRVVADRAVSSDERYCARGSALCERANTY
jgi:hypothetical protein